MSDTADDELTMRSRSEILPTRNIKKVAGPASAGPDGKRRKHKGKKVKNNSDAVEDIKRIPNLGDVSNPEEALEEILANPGAFNGMLKNISSKGGLGDIVKDVYSNPEAHEAVKEMIDAKGKTDQIRASLKQRGVKMPSRKEAMKLEKERKKIMNSNRNKSKDINCIHVNVGRKVKIVKTNPDVSIPLANRDRIRRTYLGELVICYVPGTKPNKEFWPLVKDIWRVNSKIGNEVFVYHREYKDVTWEFVKEHLEKAEPAEPEPEPECIHEPTDQPEVDLSVSEIERRSMIDE